MDGPDQINELDLTRLEEFTLESFSPLIDDVITLHIDASDKCDLKLVEVKEVKHFEGASRKNPFSLLFAASRDLQLAQRLYKLDHEALGTFALFLTPVMPDQDNNFFESIFN